MNIDLTRKRDELADKRSKRQCTTGNPDLDKAIAWYLKIGFEDGFDAGVAEMQAQNKAIIADLKEMGNNKFDAIQKLTQERDHHKDRAEHMKRRLLATSYGIKEDVDIENEKLRNEVESLKNKVAVLSYRPQNELMKERDSLKAQLQAKDAVIEIAVNELVELKEFTASILEDMNHYYDNKCIPTLDEVNQCVIAYNQTEKTIEQIQKMNAKHKGELDEKTKNVNRRS